MAAGICGQTWPRWKVYTVLLVASSVLLLTTGLLLHAWIIPEVIRAQIMKNSRLLEGEPLWKKWTEPRYKIDFNVWVHSITNPDQILDGDLPEVTTTGPYAFRKKMKNQIVSHGNGTITFKRVDHKYYDQNASCSSCSLENRAWVPNLIYQKFLEVASTSKMRPVATALVSQTPFLEVDVGELLFDGYKDPFLKNVCEIPFMHIVCDSLLNIPDRIGMLYGTNGTDDGTFTISDGVADPSTRGRVITWNGKDHVDDSWWSHESARQIRGTEGSLFPPFIEKGQRLEIFITQLCRSVYLEFQKEVEYRGIPAYRFVLPVDVFDTRLPENRGYCNPSDKRFFNSQNGSGCLPAGLLEISQCRQGKPPIVISMPSFYGAPDEVKAHIRGLNASNPETDQIYVDIEPQLGAVLHAQRVFQVNIAMWKDPSLTFPVGLQKLRPSIVPVITVREMAHMDEDSYRRIKDELLGQTALAYGLTKLLLAGSLICCLAAATIAIFAKVRAIQKRRSHELTKEYVPFTPFLPQSARKSL
ncbi:unnamed protein product, partial [Mesorhabditis spiculigera]